MKNYGLLIPEIITEGDKAHYVLGSSSKLKGAVINPSGNWIPFLSSAEVQQRRALDVMACTVFGTLNAVESLEQFYVPGIYDHSERAIAIASEVTPEGNDPHKVAETIRKTQGLVPELLLPWTTENDTWETYYSPKPLPKDVYNEGKRWWDKWTLGHDWLWASPSTPLGQKIEQLKEGLKRGSVCVSVAAWSQNEQGLYYKTYNDNHWVQLVDFKEGEYWMIYDSYEPYLKKLVWGYDFGIAKVYYLTETKKVLSIFQQILNVIGRILAIDALIVKQEPPAVLVPEVPPVPSVPELNVPEVPPKYLWDTKENVRHSIRVICDECGLTVEQKNLICSVISCESGYNPKQKHLNKDGTTDWGLCQYNDYWYIGAGKPIPSVDVALNDPEFCVREMIKQFKKGRLKDWVCYSTGLCKNYS